MKLMIYIGVVAGGILGSWLGAVLDQGNWFGGWSILVGAAGSLVGVWVGYKAGQNFN